MAANDDIYQNDGDTYQDTVYAPEVPAEQEAEIATEQAPAVASYPIMPQVAEWFADAVKECDNIDNIEVGGIAVNGVRYSRTVSIEAQVLAQQLLKQKLQEKAHEFEVYIGDVE